MLDLIYNFGETLPQPGRVSSVVRMEHHLAAQLGIGQVVRITLEDGSSHGEAAVVLTEAVLLRDAVENADHTHAGAGDTTFMGKARLIEELKRRYGSRINEVMPASVVHLLPLRRV